MVTVDQSSGFQLQRCSVLCQREVVKLLTAPPLEVAHAVQDQLPATRKVPILVSPCGKGNARVALAVTQPSATDRSRSTSNRDVAEVDVRQRGHSSAGERPCGAEVVGPHEGSHGGVGASRERQGAVDGLVGGKGYLADTCTGSACNG
jgi:hypothetical protein